MKLSAVCLLLLALTGCGSLETTSAEARDLTGVWALNQQQSDDVKARVDARFEQLAERQARRIRQEERARPSDAPPAFEAPPPPSQRWRQRRQENLRRMLQLTDQLTIRRRDAAIEIESEVETRRFTPGAQWQTSMPEGELADARAGWDGEWFVVERRVRRGPSVTEKFRLLSADQLEYLMTWRGDSELSGLSLRRIFDRAAAPPPRDPQAGPSP